MHHSITFFKFSFERKCVITNIIIYYNIIYYDVILYIKYYNSIILSYNKHLK